MTEKSIVNNSRAAHKLSKDILKIIYDSSDDKNNISFDKYFKNFKKLDEAGKRHIFDTWYNNISTADRKKYLTALDNFNKPSFWEKVLGFFGVQSVKYKMQCYRHMQTQLQSLENPKIIENNHTDILDGVNAAELASQNITNHNSVRTSYVESEYNNRESVETDWSDLSEAQNLIRKSTRVSPEDEKKTKLESQDESKATKIKVDTRYSINP